MAPIITPPPERNSQATWPYGEPVQVRTAYDDTTTSA
jgi:hypothetical protein